MLDTPANPNGGRAVTLEQRAAANHTAAATHHIYARQFHLVAARHYQIGSDYAHAAYQALIAHGHTLRAMDHLQQAIDDYAEHGVLPEQEIVIVRRGDPWKRYMDSILVASNAVTIATNLSGAEHHAAAAGHAERAAQHHGHASIHCDGREFPLAARESQIANDHALHSVYHGNAAARHYVEHFDPAIAAGGFALRI